MMEPDEQLPLLVVVACVLVDRDDKILLAQRPKGRSMAGLWEFPGGKLEAGETPEACIIRELNEELGITLQPACLAPLTFASHAYEKFHLLMPLYVARRWQGIVTPQEEQNIAWVRLNELRNYEMPPADEPLVAMLFDLL